MRWDISRWYFGYDGKKARAMQHLATGQYFRRRDMQRYPGLDVSQVVDSSSVANASLTLPTNMNIPNFCHGSSTVIFQFLSYDQLTRPSHLILILTEITLLNSGICSELKSPIIFHISVVFN